MDLDALRKQKQQRNNTESSSKNTRGLKNKCNIENANGNSCEAEHHFYLAQCYWHGLDGYEEDADKAYEEYLKAAQLGHLHAMVEVGNDYGCVTGFLGYDLEKAREWGNKALESGNVDGYDVLACCSKNWEEEKKILDIGVSKGSQSCIQSLAHNYIYGCAWSDGFILEPDKECALKLLKDVEWDKYHTYGLEMLGNLYRENGDIRLAKNSYERILELTPYDYSIMNVLGNMFRSEDKIKNYSRALELLCTSAKGNNLNAMNSYGIMLYLGEGTQQQIPTALDWFMKSADGGHTQAMINLGDHFAEDNPKEAMYWYNQAKEHGDTLGEERLQEMEEYAGSTDSIDTSKSDKIYDNFLDQDTSSSDYNDSYEKIKNKVMAIIADKLSLDEEEVHLYSRLVQDLGADSLDAIELIMEMEKEFGLTIPDEDAERIRTVGDIITYVRAHC